MSIYHSNAQIFFLPKESLVFFLIISWIIRQKNEGGFKLVYKNKKINRLKIISIYTSISTTFPNVSVILRGPKMYYISKSKCDFEEYPKSQ